MNHLEDVRFEWIRDRVYLGLNLGNGKIFDRFLEDYENDLSMFLNKGPPPEDNPLAVFFYKETISIPTEDKQDSSSSTDASGYSSSLDTSGSSRGLSTKSTESGNAMARKKSSAVFKDVGRRAEITLELESINRATRDDTETRTTREGTFTKKSSQKLAFAETELERETGYDCSEPLIPPFSSFPDENSVNKVREDHFVYCADVVSDS